MRSRRNRRKKHSRSIIWLLLGTSLLAVACGWTINTLLVKNYLWTPIVNQPNSGNPGQDTGGEGSTPPVIVPTIDRAEITLGEFTFYRVQVSALSTEDKAQALVIKLRGQGYPASCQLDAGFYKVSAGLYADKAAAHAAGELLTQMDYQVFVRETSWTGGRYTVRGELAPYVAAAAEPVAVLEAAVSQLISGQQMTPAQAKTLKDDVDAAGQALSMLRPPASAMPAHSDLMRASALLLSSVTELCQYIEGQGDQELIKALSSLMDFCNIYPGWSKGIQNLLK